MSRTNRRDAGNRGRMMAGACAAALLVCAGTALAQPAGVTVTDIGNFAGSASAVRTQSLTITTSAPVAWYKVRLPRVVAPHRFLDISTSGAGLADTEIALFTASGLLIGSDDDDGASNFSALSFGLVDPNAPSRVPPIAEAGQAPGAANDGRDGSFTANPLTGTAADYFIAVTQWDASFANGFGVARVNGPAAGLTALLTLRMGTPSGSFPPSVDGVDISVPFGETTFGPVASASDATDVSVDLSPWGGSANVEMSFSAENNEWSGFAGTSPLTQPGTFPLIYRATNAIGDVAIDTATLTVRQRASICDDASQQPVASTPGTVVYTYTTTLGDVDGPWTSACFTQSPSGNDVWFRMVAARSGTLTLSTCNADTGFTGTQPDTLLGIRTTCNTAFITCGDDVGGCGLGTRLPNIPVTAGQQYNIAVRAWSTDIVNGRLAVTFTPTGCGPSDVAGAGQTVGPDTQLTADDIILFISWFFAGDAQADIAGSGQSIGADGQFTADDIILFVNRFFAGC